MKRHNGLSMWIAEFTAPAGEWVAIFAELGENGGRLK